MNSTSNVRIRTEADYAFIKDGDVVILADPNGRRIDLNRLFDGLTTCAYT